MSFFWRSVFTILMRDKDGIRQYRTIIGRFAVVLSEVRILTANLSLKLREILFTAKG